MGLSNIGPELLMGMASLFAHKLRSLLTMLGMIFGVGAVVAMLSITAGAQKEMMSFIDQLGVNNIIVEAHRRRAERDDELHRSAGRQQHHRGSPRERGSQRAANRACGLPGSFFP